MHPQQYAQLARASGAQQAQTEYLDVNTTARRAGVSASFLNKARMTGGGPKYRKIGKTVRYFWPEVQAWLDAKACESTSQYAA